MYKIHTNKPITIIAEITVKNTYGFVVPPGSKVLIQNLIARTQESKCNCAGKLYTTSDNSHWWEYPGVVTDNSVTVSSGFLDSISNFNRVRIGVINDS